jgi:hypothetical protein
VCIHCGGSAERSLQPCIITRGKALEREASYLAELVKVVLERPAAEETAPLGAEGEGRLPRRSFCCRGYALLKLTCPKNPLQGLYGVLGNAGGAADRP